MLRHGGILVMLVPQQKQTEISFVRNKAESDVYTELGEKLHARTGVVVPIHIKTACKTCRGTAIRLS